MPPLLKQFVLFAALLVFLVMLSTKVGASTSINLQSRRTHLIAGKRTNCVFIAAYNTAFNAFSYPTQSPSPIFYINS
jgi:hypothetical protein